MWSRMKGSADLPEENTARGDVRGAVPLARVLVFEPLHEGVLRIPQVHGDPGCGEADGVLWRSVIFFWCLEQWQPHPGYQ